MADAKDKGGRRKSAAADKPRSRGPGHPVTEASRDAQEDLREGLDDLDEDLAVEGTLGVDPDELTGEGGLVTNSEGRPVIRDNRKVDPVSGRVRINHGAGEPPAAEAAETAPTPGTAEAAARALEDEVIAAAELISAREELAVRTEDLRRLSADYANYRKRVERDRAVAGEQARAELLTALIPVLDDLDAARGAGELTGPFKAVAEKLEAALGRFGMERYGAEGDVFDPTVHEALLHQTDPDSTEPRIFVVLQPGYRMGERVLRAARVGVAGQEG
ncbi:MAG: nucleotide exchange factor GrpE [Bifidobacteriaceae bacterium]|jgi:molecular chaperone GrpE|nr:nucleotide exchange factor GrpE [Bifidobacteriaceae bacterium]